MPKWNNIELSSVSCWRSTPTNPDNSDAEIAIKSPKICGHFVLKQNITREESEQIGNKFLQELTDEIEAVIARKIAGLKKAKA